MEHNWGKVSRCGMGTFVVFLVPLLLPASPDALHRQYVCARARDPLIWQHDTLDKYVCD